MKIVGLLVIGVVGVVLLLLLFSLASGADGIAAVRAVCRMIGEVTRAIARAFYDRGGDGRPPA